MVGSFVNLPSHSRIAVKFYPINGYNKFRYLFINFTI